MSYSKLPPILFLLLLLGACTTSSPRNRGSLSDAMDKSRDDYEQEREVPDEPDPPMIAEEEDPEDPRHNREEAPSHTKTEKSGLGPLQLLVRGGYGFKGGPFFDKSYSGELLLGDRIGRRGELYLYAGFDKQETDSSHSVSESIKGDVLSLGAGLEGRFYPLPDMSFFSPYVLGRIGGFIMFWEFRNALSSGDETIKSDRLGGLLLGTGLGVDLIRSERFKLGLAVIPELSLYGKETGQGFTNDLFERQGIIRVCAEGGISF